MEIYKRKMTLTTKDTILKQHPTRFKQYDLVIWIKENKFAVGRYIYPCEESQWDNTPKLKGCSTVAFSALTGRANIPNNQLKKYNKELYLALCANPELINQTSSNHFAMGHDEDDYDPPKEISKERPFSFTGRGQIHKGKN